MNTSLLKCWLCFSFSPQILDVSVVCEDLVHKSQSEIGCLSGRTKSSSSFDLNSVVAGFNPGLVEPDISNEN